MTTLTRRLRSPRCRRFEATSIRNWLSVSLRQLPSRRSRRSGAMGMCWGSSRCPCESGSSVKRPGLHRIYLQEGRRGRVVEEILRLAKARHVPVAFEAREGLDRRVGSGRHQGAVGIASTKAYLSLDDLLEAVRRHDLPLLLVLDGI